MVILEDVQGGYLLVVQSEDFQLQIVGAFHFIVSTFKLILGGDSR